MTESAERHRDQLRAVATGRLGAEVEFVQSRPVSVEPKGEKMMEVVVYEFRPRRKRRPRLYAWFQHVRREPEPRPVAVVANERICCPRTAVEWFVARCAGRHRGLRHPLPGT